MILPLYQGIDTPRKSSNSHKGLWFERFFNHYKNDNWSLDDGNTNTEQDKKGVNAKRLWIESVIGVSGQKSAIEKATQQQLNLSLSLAGDARVYTAVWHITTGLGNTHPVENGFCWHPTLGTPYIAGSAVKGLIRSWIECWSELDEQGIKDTCLRWFGSEDKDPTQTDKDSQAGGFIFFDALPTEPVTLHCDVMTPHMGQWYSDGGQIKSTSESDKLPADWHNPIPIPFLVVKSASFLFSIAPRTEDMKSELPQIMEALDSAVSYLGVGAKTAAGYGLLDPAPEKLRKMKEQQIKKEEESHFIIATLAIKSGILGIKLPSEKEPFYLPSDKSTEYMNLLYPEKLDQKGRKKRNDKINKGNTKIEVRVRSHANFTDILELRPLEENKE